MSTIKLDGDTHRCCNDADCDNDWPCENHSALAFVLGHVSAYVEQVNAGAKLAAQIGCRAGDVAEILEQVKRDGPLLTLVEQRELGRASVWMFKHEIVREIIRGLQSADVNATTAIWAMGKLFGYSDAEIVRYLEELRAALPTEKK